MLLTMRVGECACAFWLKTRVDALLHPYSLRRRVRRSFVSPPLMLCAHEGMERRSAPHRFGPRAAQTSVRSLRHSNASNGGALWRKGARLPALHPATPKLRWAVFCGGYDSGAALSIRLLGVLLHLR